MKVPVSWLNEYIDLTDISTRELSDLLTFSGIEVESIDEVGVLLDDNFVVAEVLACEQHPNADKLKVCQVSDGSAEYQIVCGAPNARAGLKVALAKLGAVIPSGNFTIKRAKLRGMESFGMLCSGAELQLSEDSQGILELPAESRVGRPLRDVLPAPETVFDLEITWNRADCLSMIGVARELAALLERPLHLPALDFVESDIAVQELVQVEIQEPQLCPRYTARVLRDVKQVATPAWMQQRLELCGIRSHSLAVDVTNYVLLECGQPLHAFDYHAVQEQKIVVRRALEDECMMTLDGIKRKLKPANLVIADVKMPLAVAGVMGGLTSEIQAESRDVLLESALFDAPATHHTALQLGLASDSSHRFERGVDPELADWASRRATHLLVTLGGAQVARGVVDVDYRDVTPRRVALPFKRVREVIGVELSDAQIVAYLERLNLSLVDQDAQGAVFQIPTYRLDLTVAADLIEEVARLHGLAAIPDRLPAVTAVSLLDDGAFYQRVQCRQALVGLGFSEAMHYSFLSARELDAFDDRHPTARLVLPNPVSADYGVLRDSLLPQLALALGRNAARQVKTAALFELGHVFATDAEGGLREEEHLALGMMGPCWRPKLDQRRAFSPEEALLALKGGLEQFLRSLRLPMVVLRPQMHPSFEAGWSFELLLEDVVIGCMGLLTSSWRHQWRVASPMPLAELKLAPLLQRQDNAVARVHAVPAYPAIRRDIAIVAPEDLEHATLVRLIRSVQATNLTGLELFDIFKSKAVGNNRRSLAYALEFRSPERTLTDQEVNQSLAKIIAKLREELGVEIREG